MLFSEIVLYISFVCFVVYCASPFHGFRVFDSDLLTFSPQLYKRVFLFLFQFDVGEDPDMMQGEKWNCRDDHYLSSRESSYPSPTSCVSSTLAPCLDGCCCCWFFPFYAFDWLFVCFFCFCYMSCHLAKALFLFFGFTSHPILLPLHM